MYLINISIIVRFAHHDGKFGKLFIKCMCSYTFYNTSSKWHVHACIHMEQIHSQCIDMEIQDPTPWRISMIKKILFILFILRLSAPQPYLQTPWRLDRHPPAVLSSLHPVQSAGSLRSASRCSPSSPAQIAPRTRLLLQLQLQLQLQFQFQSPLQPPDPRRLGTLIAVPRAVGMCVSLASDPCVAPTARCTPTSASWGLPPATTLRFRRRMTGFAVSWTSWRCGRVGLGFGFWLLWVFCIYDLSSCMNVSVLVYRSLCVWRFYMCFCLTVSASVFLLVSVSVIQDLVAFHQLRFHLIKYTGDDDAG